MIEMNNFTVRLQMASLTKLCLASISLTKIKKALQ